MSWVPKLEVFLNVNTLVLSVTAAAGTAWARNTTFVPRPSVNAKTIAVVRRCSRSQPSARIARGTAVPTSAGTARSVSLAAPHAERVALQRALEEDTGEVHEGQSQRVRDDERPAEDLAPHRQLLPEDEHADDPREGGE